MFAFYSARKGGTSGGLLELSVSHLYIYYTKLLLNYQYIPCTVCVIYGTESKLINSIILPYSPVLSLIVPYCVRTYVQTIEHQGGSEHHIQRVPPHRLQ